MPLEKDTKQNQYLDERRLLVEAELAQSQTLDKALLTLSSSALVISLTLAERFLSKNGDHTTWLIFAWCFFGGATICTVISLFTSQTALRCQRDILDAKHCNSNTNKINRWATATSLLNIVALVLFVAGVFILTKLVWLGLQSGQ
jgi:hypothetical protein